MMLSHQQADAEPAGSRVCTKSAQMLGARRRSNARSIRRGAQRRSGAFFVQTLRGGALRGPAAAAALRKQRSAGGPYDRAPGLASLRPRIARSSALLRALRIVPLFVCGSRRASRPAKHRRGPMGFCISLPVLLRQREVMHRKEIAVVDPALHRFISGSAAKVLEFGH